MCNVLFFVELFILLLDYTLLLDGCAIIRQIKRAQRAVELLHQGNPIIDTAHELGYADQSHLTHSLKRFLGYTPGEIVASTFQTG